MVQVVLRAYSLYPYDWWYEYILIKGTLLRDIYLANPVVRKLTFMIKTRISNCKRKTLVYSFFYQILLKYLL